MLGSLNPLPMRLVADALQGLSAEQHARLSADLRCSVRTMPLAALFAGPTGVFSYTSQMNVGVAFAPTLVAVSTGVYTLAWQAAYSDSFGNSCPFAPTLAAITTFETPLMASWEIVATALPTLRVRLFDAAGSPDDADFFCAVW